MSAIISSMRLSPQLGHSHFHNNPKEIQPLKDFFDVFHGQYLCTKTHFGLDQFSYRTDDGYVTGTSAPLGGCDFERSVTEMWVNELTLPKQTARWTAVEAYKQLYYAQYETDSWFKGFRGRHLVLAAPDQRGVREWAGRSDSEPDFSLETTYDERDLANDKEIAIFIARGDTLLSAAQTMVRGYGELFSSSEIDPSLSELDASMTIAQALGSTSMEHFEEMWSTAMEQPEPQMAARYVYQALTA